MFERLKKLFRPVPDRRRNARIYDRPLLLLIEGYEYKTLDWSLSGFRIAAFHRPMTRLERFDGMIGAIDGEGRGEFTAEVARIAANGEIGARFLEVSSAKFAAMSRQRAG